MANTMTLIASVTVGSSGSATIDFTSISSSYTDLCLVISARSNYAGIYDGLSIVINSDTAANYSRVVLLGDGATATSSTSSGNNSVYAIRTATGNTATASTFGNTSVYFPNYRASTQKSISVDGVGENNATTAYAALESFIWTGTAAITSLSIAPTNGTSWNQYSTAYLYGIKNS
jgi:hypothetical protein